MRKLSESYDARVSITLCPVAAAELYVPIIHLTVPS